MRRVYTVQIRSSDDDPGMVESTMQEYRTDVMNKISDGVTVPSDEQDTQNEYLTVIP